MVIACYHQLWHSWAVTSMGRGGWQPLNREAFDVLKNFEETGQSPTLCKCSAFLSIVLQVSIYLRATDPANETSTLRILQKPWLHWCTPFQHHFGCRTDVLNDSKTSCYLHSLASSQLTAIPPLLAIHRSWAVHGSTTSFRFQASSPSRWKRWLLHVLGWWLLSHWLSHVISNW